MIKSKKQGSLEKYSAKAISKRGNGKSVILQHKAAIGGTNH